MYPDEDYEPTDEELAEMEAALDQGDEYDIDWAEFDDWLDEEYDRDMEDSDF